MIKLLKKIYHLSPLFVMKTYLYFYSIYCKIRSNFLPLYVIEGTPNDSYHVLRFCYFGWDHKIMGHWLKRIFQKYDQIQYIKLVPFWRIHKYLKNKTLGCDLAILELSNKHFRKYTQNATGFELPRWLKMYIDVEISLSLIRKDGDIPRLIKKNDLSMEKGSTDQDFQFFYDKMYLPNVITRHKDGPVIEEYKLMLKEFHRCNSTIYFVIKDGQRVAGLYVQFFERPFLHALGTINGSNDALKMGAIGALYYFVLIDQMEQNVKYINIGGTSPLLKDGLTRFKLSLGAKVGDYKKQDSPRLKLMPLVNSASVKDFLSSNPFVYIENENLYCAAFKNEEQEAPNINYQKLYSRSTAMGLDKPRVFCFNSKNKLSECMVDSAQILETAKFSH